MPDEISPRSALEAELRFNEITDKETARKLAQLEKPIRDLSRDPEAAVAVRALKPLLDKEAERLSGKAENIARGLGMETVTGDASYYRELLGRSIWDFKLSSTRLTTNFFKAVQKLKIETIADLTKCSLGDISGTAGVGPVVALEVNEWLKNQGLKFGMTDEERRKITGQ